MAGSNATEEDLDLLQTYMASVFAENNVRGARNGPNVEVEGIMAIHQHVHTTYMNMQLISFITVYYAETFRSLSGPDLFNLARYSQVNIIVRLHVQASMPITLCLYDAYTCTLFLMIELYAISMIESSICDVTCIAMTVSG